MVDLHGQHEHQSLLRNETHIDFLDEFGNFGDLAEDYKKLYNELQHLLKELKELKEKESSLREKKDFYSFQIKEIDSVSPAEDEEDKLVEELIILENSEKLASTTSDIYGLIYEDENSVYDSIIKIKNELNELTGIDKSFGESYNECENAIALINDIAEFVRNYKSKIEVDPAEVNRKRDRLGAINLLKKKYGGTVNSVLEYRNKIGAEFDLAENFSEKINSFEKEIDNLRQECGKAAENISRKRKQTSVLINKDVKEVLSDLGIPDSNFEVRMAQNKSSSGEDFVIVKGNKYSYSPKGIDEVEFYISTNVGEDLKPLAKVASGGEVSRIMLALKTILAKNDRFPLLIFDEIDTGVSGRIAQKVGKALKSLAKFYQVISITHLPQIAGLADHHFIVEKNTNDGRVVSSIKEITENERVKEVAKLMSGEKVTEASLEGARELLNSR
jgi:DNA repair protein RecN (Recombination protein N)